MAQRSTGVSIYGKEGLHGLKRGWPMASVSVYLAKQRSREMFIDQVKKTVD